MPCQPQTTCSNCSTVTRYFITMNGKECLTNLLLVWGSAKQKDITPQIARWLSNMSKPHQPRMGPNMPGVFKSDRRAEMHSPPSREPLALLKRINKSRHLRSCSMLPYVLFLPAVRGLVAIRVQKSKAAPRQVRGTKNLRVLRESIEPVRSL